MCWSWCVISPCGDISRLQVAYFSIFCLLFYCLSSSVLVFFFFFPFYRLTKPTDFEQVGLSFVQKSPTDKTSHPQTHNCQLKTTHRRENFGTVECGGGFSLLIKKNFCFTIRYSKFAFFLSFEVSVNYCLCWLHMRGEIFVICFNLMAPHLLLVSASYYNCAC